MSSPATHVRDATSDDVDSLVQLMAQVQALHAQGRPDLFRPGNGEALREFLLARLAEEATVLIAEGPEGRPLGYLLAESTSRPESPFLLAHTGVYVHHIAVDAGARRQRVGELLMDDIAERARQASASTLRLDSWSFNADAHRFFEAQGFAASRVIFERPVDAADGRAEG